MDPKHVKCSHASGRAGRPRLAMLSLGVTLFVLAGCGPKNPETFKIRSGDQIERSVKFDAGAKVQIWVDSEQNSDVDLFVYDASGNKVAVDEGDSQNCHVAFTADSTQTYKIQVQNRTLTGPGAPTHRNIDNRCTLRWEPKQ
jgi:Bacterial pre-peptidase C-terminal domain